MLLPNLKERFATLITTAELSGDYAGDVRLAMVIIMVEGTGVEPATPTLRT